MNLTIITPPVAILAAADARVMVPALRDADAGYIAMLIGAAQAQIEPPNGWTGRAFGPQTLEVAVHGGRLAESAVIILPCSPVRAITSVTYVDSEGQAQTLPPDHYALVGSQRLAALAVRKPAPTSVLRAEEAVVIRFEAGFDLADPALMPARHALALMVQDLQSMAREDIFLKRETTEGIGTVEWVVSSAAADVISRAADRLLGCYRLGGA